MIKKRNLVGEGLGVNLSLIITPMLDMAFQLMAFFIMTFQPLSEEKNITGRLLPPMKEEQVKKKDVPMKGKKKADKDSPPPETKIDKDKEKDTDPDTKEDPNPKDVVRVIVEINDPNETDPKKISGKPGRILLKFPEDTQPEVIADLGDSFESGLNKMTKKLTAWKGRDEAKLQIEVHPDLRYGYFIQLQDVCRAAKFKELGFPKPIRPKKVGSRLGRRTLPV